MNLSFPSFHFNQDLQEIPDSIDEFQKFIDHIIILLYDKSLNNRLQLLSELGVAYRILRRFELAEAYLTEALKLAVLTDNKEAIFAANIRLAHCFQWQKRFQLSNSIFNNLQMNFLNEVFNPVLKSSFWQHKGKNEFDQKNYEEALKCFEIALEIRIQHKLSQNLIESTQVAILETKERLKLKRSFSMEGYLEI